MRHGLSIVAPVLVLAALAACGGRNEDEPFLGQWKFISGIRNGVICYEKKNVADSWVGQQITVTRDPNPEPNVGTRLLIDGLRVCPETGYWFVRGDIVDFSNECMYAGMVGRPGAQIKTYSATLKVMGRMLTLINLTENESWVDKGAVLESCRFTTENAQLNYVGP